MNIVEHSKFSLKYTSRRQEIYYKYLEKYCKVKNKILKHNYFSQEPTNFFTKMWFFKKWGATFCKKKKKQKNFIR